MATLESNRAPIGKLLDMRELFACVVCGLLTGVRLKKASLRNLRGSGALVGGRQHPIHRWDN
jgi:hypothetical protein